MAKQNNPGEYVRKKIKRPRKPMSPEQKAAAIERLAAARAKRHAANPPQYKNVAQSVLDLPEDDMLAFEKVRGWIKTNREEMAGFRQEIRANVKGSIAKLASTQGYVQNMERYLRSGDWMDNYYGERRQHRITRQCVSMAYHDNGDPKRERHCYYSDIEKVWEGETEDELRAEGYWPNVGKVRA